jgi:hypothetical protein
MRLQPGRRAWTPGSHPGGLSASPLLVLDRRRRGEPVASSPSTHATPLDPQAGGSAPRTRDKALGPRQSRRAEEVTARPDTPYPSPASVGVPRAGWPLIRLRNRHGTLLRRFFDFDVFRDTEFAEVFSDLVGALGVQAAGRLGLELDVQFKSTV